MKKLRYLFYAVFFLIGAALLSLLPLPMKDALALDYRALGTVIGSAVTGGTAGSVVFINQNGNLAQDNTNFTYSSTTLKLTVSSITTNQISSANGVFSYKFSGVGSALGNGNQIQVELSTAGTNAAAITALTILDQGAHDGTGVLLFQPGNPFKWFDDALTDYFSSTAAYKGILAKGFTIAAQNSGVNIGLEFLSKSNTDTSFISFSGSDTVNTGNLSYQASSAAFALDRTIDFQKGYTSSGQVYAFVTTTGAFTNVTGNNVTWTVQFSSALINVTNSFSTTTWTFTAPATGHYLVTSNMSMTGIVAPGTNTDIQMQFVSTQGTYVKAWEPIPTVASTVFFPIDYTNIIPMNKGDTLTVAVQVKAGTQIIGTSSNTPKCTLAIQLIS